MPCAVVCATDAYVRPVGSVNEIVTGLLFTFSNLTFNSFEAGLGYTESDSPSGLYHL